MAALTLPILAFTVNPANAGNQVATYDVYAGGVHAVEAKLTMNTDAKKYDVELYAKTRGFLGKVAPWYGTFSTKGIMKNGNYQPLQHQSVATWKDEKEIKTYSYNKDGSFKSYTIDEHDKPLQTPELADEMVQGTTDALSAAMTVFTNYLEDGSCNGSSEVFDGKRRFQQIFANEEPELLKTSRYNVYGGDTAVCTVEVIPVAGKWHEKPRGWMSIQEQGRDRGMMPTVWLTSLNETGPAIPVKIRVKTAYGTLFMHLTGWSDGQKVLKLKD